ncbi:hypothetical protein M0802_010365 [Mischocyttarus mexicanus]|nr:hypothetical protein M0802_010365 [Mischocyttarus mexicanus]
MCPLHGGSRGESTNEREDEVGRELVVMVVVVVLVVDILYRICRWSGRWIVKKDSRNIRDRSMMRKYVRVLETFTKRNNDSGDDSTSSQWACCRRASNAKQKLLKSYRRL